MVQKLASEFFWPRFQKQDGRHGCFIQIFRDFCCPSISKGVQCTRSKFAGYPAGTGPILDIMFWSC